MHPPRAAEIQAPGTALTLHTSHSERFCGSESILLLGLCIFAHALPCLPTESSLATPAPVNLPCVHPKPTRQSPRSPRASQHPGNDLSHTMHFIHNRSFAPASSTRSSLRQELSLL